MTDGVNVDNDVASPGLAGTWVGRLGELASAPGVVAAEVVRGKAQAAAPGTAGGLFTKAVYNGRLSGNDETMNVPQLMRHIEECT